MTPIFRAITTSVKAKQHISANKGGNLAELSGIANHRSGHAGHFTIAIVAILVLTCSLFAQTHTEVTLEDPQTITALKTLGAGAVFGLNITFATLPASPSNGFFIYCTDCVAQNPCAGGGAGAFAQRINGVYNCAAAGSGSPGTVAPGTTGTIIKYTDGAGAVVGNSLADDGVTTANTLTYAGSAGIAATKLKSTVATGTAPLTVASTTLVANLHAATADSATTATSATSATSATTATTATTATNANQLLSNTWAAPADIGTTTPAAGTFTTGTFNNIVLAAGGACTGCAPAGSSAGQIVVSNGAGSLDKISGFFFDGTNLNVPGPINMAAAFAWSGPGIAAVAPATGNATFGMDENNLPYWWKDGGVKTQIPINFAQVVSLWANGSCSGSLNSDGTCSTNGASLPAHLSYADPTLTVSAATFGNGQVKLSGNTSGTCNLTTDATSTTVTSSCTPASTVISTTSNGNASTPAIQINSANSGFYAALANVPAVSSGGTSIAAFPTAGVKVPSSKSYVWSLANDVTSNPDLGVSRDAAGVLDVGNGSAGNTNGKVKAAGYISVGTAFTSNAGCTESTLVGGATAGKFTVGQNTACTIIITMGNSATSPNGWACAAYDQTAVPAVAIRQTASNATTASLLMTVATNDVVTFHCLGY